jgi:hypothetical protein
MKIPSVGAELFDVGGGTDMTIAAFRDFEKAPKMGRGCYNPKKNLTLHFQLRYSG